MCFIIDLSFFFVVDEVVHLAHIQTNPTTHSSQQTTVMVPFSLKDQTIHTGFSLGQPATYALAVICSLLVILICTGLFCLFCVWGRKHVRTPFRHHFSRSKKKRLDGSPHFDSVDRDRKPSHQTNLLSDHFRTLQTKTYDVQHQFQHPTRCQEVSVPIPNTTAYLAGFHLFPGNGVTPLGVGLATTPLNQNFRTLNHPSLEASRSLLKTPNGLDNPPNGNCSTSLATSVFGPTDMLQFLPLNVNNVSLLLSYLFISIIVRSQLFVSVTVDENSSLSISRWDVIAYDNRRSSPKKFK